MEHISAILANCWWMILLSALIAYLLGSINTAVLVTGIVTKGKKDIRQMGSGNAGFTNVLRSVGKVPAIITIVCDALKCIIAVLIGGFIFSFASVAFQGESPVFINELINCGKYVAGIFCILGHSYPVYFHFKGGKGVVTAAALMLTEDWRVFIAIIVTFLIIFLCSKIISLASVLCAILYAPYTFAMTFIFDFIIYKDYSLTYVIFSTAAALLIGVFVLVKHKENIKRLLKGEEKKITAYHESGHALLFHLLPDVGPVHTVSIIPTGAGAAGYTMPLPEKDEMFNSRGRMLQEIVVDLGGRVAEELVFDDITTGASQDIKQATKMARDMVTRYGMSENIGLICYKDDDDEVFIGRDLAHAHSYSEGIASAIDVEVKRIIDESYEKAKTIIAEHRDVLDRCAALLLEKEKITREEFEALFEA
jgi:glycerol-3-phosphate acyltransferase PlsY